MFVQAAAQLLILTAFSFWKGRKMWWWRCASQSNVDPMTKMGDLIKVKLYFFISWHMTFKAHFHTTGATYHGPDSFGKWVILKMGDLENVLIALYHCYDLCDLETVLITLYHYCWPSQPREWFLTLPNDLKVSIILINFKVVNDDSIQNMMTSYIELYWPRVFSHIVHSCFNLKLQGSFVFVYLQAGHRIWSCRPIIIFVLYLMTLASNIYFNNCSFLAYQILISILDII